MPGVDPQSLPTFQDVRKTPAFLPSLTRNHAGLGEISPQFLVRGHCRQRLQRRHYRAHSRDGEHDRGADARSVGAPGVRLVRLAGCRWAAQGSDREADIYELFAEAAQDPSGPKLLIRTQHDRALEDEAARLFETIAAQPVAGYLHVQIPRQHDRPAREAKLAIRLATLNVRPPQGKAGLPVLPLQAVQALEEPPPKGEAPVDWRLLTTLPVHHSEQAIEKVQWYTQRWGIEVFHRTLKSGCRIEDRQLGEADRLEACLAVDMVVAWRICHLVKLGREVPHLPATVYFEEAQWKALVAYHTKKPLPPAKPPTLGRALHMVAQLGGFRGRKSDGEPGAEVLWRGIQRHDDITATWRVIQAHNQQLQSRIDELTEALNVAMARGP